jgi:hypothetical protein
VAGTLDDLGVLDWKQNRLEEARQELEEFSAPRRKHCGTLGSIQVELEPQGDSQLDKLVVLPLDDLPVDRSSQL